MNSKQRVVVTGVRGVIGSPLVSALEQEGYSAITVGRTSREGAGFEHIVQDLQLPFDRKTSQTFQEFAPQTLIHCAPIWLLPDNLSSWKIAGVKRILVFSSTSVLSKKDSPSVEEQYLVERLNKGESETQDYCNQNNIELTIFRPTMVYGNGLDANVMQLARFILRYRFAAVAGSASGLRQPVHAQDIVDLLISVLQKPDHNCERVTYTLSGAEVLTYREMLVRIFESLGKRPVIIGVPLWLMRTALRLAANFGSFAYTDEMADRMNQDLVYEHTNAKLDLGFSPRPFVLDVERDLPLANQPPV